MKHVTSLSNSADNRQTRPFRQSLGKVLLAVLLAMPLALTTTHARATPNSHIIIYENGVPTDETSLYSYSQSHLIWGTTQEVVGGTMAGDPFTLYDLNGNVIGYLAYTD